MFLYGQVLCNVSRLKLWLIQMLPRLPLRCHCIVRIVQCRQQCAVCRGSRPEDRGGAAPAAASCRGRGQRPPHTQTPHLMHTDAGLCVSAERGGGGQRQPRRADGVDELTSTLQLTSAHTPKGAQTTNGVYATITSQSGDDLHFRAH